MNSKRKGFSLVSVLVAAALIGMLSMVVANVIGDGQKGQLAIQQRDEFNKLLDYAKLVLATRENCGLDLDSLQTRTFMWSDLAAGPVTITLAQIGANGEITPNYPLSGLKLGDIKLEIRSRIEDKSRADARIVFSANKLMNTPGGKTLQDSGLPIVIDTIGGDDTAPQYITKCFALANEMATESVDPSAMCDLLGRAYDEENGRCHDVNASTDLLAMLDIAGNQALMANQAPISCGFEDKGIMKSLPCSPTASEHRTRPKSGSNLDIAELKPNTSVSTKNRSIASACYYDNADKQWYRGSLYVPKGTPASPAIAGVCGDLKTAGSACYKSHGQDKYRQICQNVKVANVSSDSEIAVVGAYTKGQAAHVPASLDKDLDWWKNAFKDENQQAELDKVEACYIGGGNGTPPSKERECYQNVNTKTLSDGTKTFKSWPTRFCLYSKTQNPPRWRILTSGKWYTCNGGVKINNASNVDDGS